MARPRMPIGQHGSVSYTTNANGSVTAYTRLRFPDGKLRPVKYTAASRAKADIGLEAKCREKSSYGGNSVQADMRMSELRDLFLKDREHKISDGSVTAYRSASKHIVERLGALSVVEAARPAVLQSFIDWLQENRGAGVAKTCKTVLSGMFSIAIRNDVLTHNPAKELDRIKQSRDRATDPIPLDKLHDVFAAMEGIPDLVRNDEVELLKFMCWTGLRVSEACGLCWDCVDLDAGEISVERQSHYSKGRGIVLKDSTKTEAGRRKIRLASYAVAMLRARKVWLADRENPHNLVFPLPWGAIRDEGLLNRHIRENREKLGCLDLRISSHSFRKVCSNTLNVLGASSREVADYIGHEKTQVTEAVYIRRYQNTEHSAHRLDECVELASI